ncbi:hypothetical protein Ciccas_001025 [Cichlidogyrus casuarinus]|uniref:Uncharacterized protein n=1 Tax=Cichlidogyrus casuarinus TaxID=1844966 RepID=A0ABD2QL93_9PLAT
MDDSKSILLLHPGQTGHHRKLITSSSISGSLFPSSSGGRSSSTPHRVGSLKLRRSAGNQPRNRNPPVGSCNSILNPSLVASSAGFVSPAATDASFERLSPCHRKSLANYARASSLPSSDYEMDFEIASVKLKEDETESSKERTHVALTTSKSFQPAGTKRVCTFARLPAKSTETQPEASFVPMEREKESQSVDPVNRLSFDYLRHVASNIQQQSYEPPSFDFFSTQRRKVCQEWIPKMAALSKKAAECAQKAISSSMADPDLSPQTDEEEVLVPMQVDQGNCSPEENETEERSESTTSTRSRGTFPKRKLFIRHPLRTLRSSILGGSINYSEDLASSGILGQQKSRSAGSRSAERSVSVVGDIRASSNQTVSMGNVLDEPQEEDDDASGIDMLRQQLTANSDSSNLKLVSSFE